MSSTEIKKLNAYPEWRDISKLNQVIKFIKGEDTELKDLNDEQKKRFLEKFDNDDWKVEGNTLFYQPSDRIKLEVVKPADHKRKLKVL